MSDLAYELREWAEGRRPDMQARLLVCSAADHIEAFTAKIEELERLRELRHQDYEKAMVALGLAQSDLRRSNERVADLSGRLEEMTKKYGVAWGLGLKLENRVKELEAALDLVSDRIQSEGAVNNA